MRCIGQRIESIELLYNLDHPICLSCNTYNIITRSAIPAESFSLSAHYGVVGSFKYSLYFGHQSFTQFVPSISIVIVVGVVSPPSKEYGNRHG